ncbi:MAG: hypothetical protein R3343_01385 [Nitriliruptorales bacterium]|nr:hypothetical protein [Nitriliruptorales bacterium]
MRRRTSKPRLRLTRRGAAVLAVATAIVAVAGVIAVARIGPSPDAVAAAPVASPSPRPSPTAVATPTPAPTPSPSVFPLDGRASPRLFDEPMARLDLNAVDGFEDAHVTHAAARAFFGAAPTVVVVEDATPALDAGTALALRYRAPLLVAGAGLEGILTELEAQTALTVGDVGGVPLDDVRPVPFTATASAWSEPQPDDDPGERAAAHRWGLHRLEAIATSGRSAHRIDRAALRGTGGGQWSPSSSGTTVLVPRTDPALAAPAVSAMAAGHRVVPALPGDPRADARIGGALEGMDLSRMLLLGADAEWDAVDPAALPWQLAVAQSGLELPGGGQLVFPGRRFVALYGTPGSGALGVLGEQPVEQAVARAVAQAKAYAPLSDVPVVPTFEIIATIAAGAAGPDGDYSDERSLDDLRPWVDAAERAGVYVVLDLQPGRESFVTQVQRYEELLARPHVGLALDPEWRLRANQRHLVQIGGVDAAEVNAVSEWLAGLVRVHRLPQKLFVIHQFKLSMIRDRSSLVARPELATLIQMDGQGSQPTKVATWDAIRRDPPDGVWWGWKNFHDEDRPMRSPTDTMALDPPPLFISYQ